MRPSPLHIFSHFSVLPHLVGWRTLGLAFVARAPQAMLPLGAMTAVRYSTGSIALAGLATAVVSAASALCAPLIGRWSDQKGQRLVLSVLVPLGVLSLAALTWTCVAHTTGPALWAALVAVGATGVQIGTFTRAQWSSAHLTPSQLSAAFSYESMADETVFVLGPALVGLLASIAWPIAPLVFAATLMAVSTIPFALKAPRDTTDHAVNDQIVRPSIWCVLWRISPALIIMTSLGVFFGSTQAGITERATQLGNPSMAGLAYAPLGITSAIAALLLVLVPESFALSKRSLIGGLGIAVTMTAVWLAPSLPLIATVMFLGGVFIGPTMVTAFSLAHLLAPHGGSAVAMTATGAGVTVGVAAGAACGGMLANDSASLAFALSGAAGLLIIVISIVLELKKRVPSKQKFQVD